MICNKQTKNKIIIGVFLLFFLFSAIGSNLYFVSTLLSFRNIFFIGLFLIIFILIKVKFNVTQIVILIPILAFYFIGVISLFIHGNFEIDVLKDFFYFTFIPIQFITILILGNKYQNFFFRSVYYLSVFIIFLLFAISIFEIKTGTHLPSYNTLNKFAPTAFFTNPNDLAAITVSIYMLLMSINYKQNKINDIIISGIVGFIVFVTLSRAILVVFLLLVILKYISNKFIERSILLVLGLSVLFLIVSRVEVPKESKSLIDRSIIRMSTIIDLKTQKKIKSSSVNVRYNIYKIPFENPKEFLIGDGFNSDKKIINKYIGKGANITNSHSFFIQSIFYFGWIGFFLLIVFFILLVIYSITNRNVNNYFLPIILSQMIIINIPSSIIRMPLIWLPFFIIISYFTINKNDA